MVSSRTVPTPIEWCVHILCHLGEKAAALVHLENSRIPTDVQPGVLLPARLSAASILLIMKTLNEQIFWPC